MAKKYKTGRPAKGEHKDITIRIYDEEYPGLKEFIDKYSQTTNETQNNYIIKILDIYKNSIEFNDDPQKLYDLFTRFDENSKKKISFYKETLEKEDFLKKMSLKDVINKIYPHKTEKHNFFLTFFIFQFSSELKLLDILMSFDSFLQFLCEKENVSVNKNKILKIYDNLLFTFQLNWYNELIFNRVILNEKDFENINFNFDMLENLFLKMYNGYQKQLSFKEQREKTILKKKEKKKTSIESLKYRVKILFRELIKNVSGLCNEVLHLEKNKYSLFRKIGYHPSKFFLKLIKLDEYIDFIKKNKLEKVLSYLIDEQLLLYKNLNSIPFLPSIDLITNLNFFFSNLKSFEVFLKNLPEQIKKTKFNKITMKQIGFRLKMILDNYQKGPFFIKELIKKIPMENLSVFTELPKNLLETYNFIRDYLKRKGFDLENEFEKINNKAEMFSKNI